MKSGKDTGEQNETNGKNERIEVTNETLKGSSSGSRTRTERKKTTEASSKLSRER